MIKLITISVKNSDNLFSIALHCFGSFKILEVSENGIFPKDEALFYKTLRVFLWDCKLMKQWKNSEKSPNT